MSHIILAILELRIQANHFLEEQYLPTHRNSVVESKFLDMYSKQHAGCADFKEFYLLKNCVLLKIKLFLFRYLQYLGIVYDIQ